MGAGGDYGQNRSDSASTYSQPSGRTEYGQDRSDSAPTYSQPPGRTEIFTVIH